MRSAVQEAGGGRVTTTDDLARLLAQMMGGSAAGVSVTPDSAMTVAAVFASVRLVSGAVANLPGSGFRRIDERTREKLPDHAVTRLLWRRPNQWQTPAQFKRMLQAHLLLRGNGFALIVRSRGLPVALVPLDPDRVVVEEVPGGLPRYRYQRADGREVIFVWSDVFHLVGLSLDGVRGVSVLTYARESIGLSLAQDRHGARTFKNAGAASNVLVHPGKIGTEAADNLRASVDAYRAGGENEGRTLVLEEGMTVQPLSLTAQDAQWIESRKFSRGDIAMFFGVPPHMIGDTEKATSWGSGIEQQGIGFVTYTLEDHLTTWEQTADRDLVSDADIFTQFDRQALTRGDIKTRQGFYTAMMQWGVYSADDIREKEGENPRPDGGGGVYYEPPNAPGGAAAADGGTQNVA